MNLIDPSLPQPFNPEQKEEVSRRLAGPIVSIRSRRRLLEEKWLYCDAAYKAEVRPERKKFRSESFDYYIPVARRSTNRFVNRMVQMMLPSSDFFECYPGDEGNPQAGLRADAVRAYMSYILRRRLKIRRLVAEVSRSFCIFGRGIVKAGVMVSQQQVDYAGVQGPLEEIWPTARTVDPFSFYVWPETVSNIEDAVMVFEDSMVPLNHYNSMAVSGLCDPIPQDEVGNPVWPHHITMRMQYQGFPNPSSMTGAAIDTQGSPVPTAAPQKFISLTEVWFYMETGQLVQVWLVWNVPKSPLCVRVNMSEFPEIPYFLAQASPMAGEQYTLGLMSDLEPLQILYNDQVNQGEEARATTAFPPIALDPSMGGNRSDQFVFGYRKKWIIQNPKQSVVPIELPDTYTSSLRAQGNTLQMIDVLGASPRMLEGQPTRGLPRGTQAVNSLITLAAADIKDACEIIETEILTPLLARLHRLSVLFIPPVQIMRIPGTQYYPAKTIDVRELEGNWDLVWVGSQQAQEMKALAQQMNAAAQGIAKVEPLLNKQGVMINWPLFIKRMWRDGMGERGVEQIIMPMTPQMQQVQAQQMVNQAGPPPPGGPPGPPAGPGANAAQVEQRMNRANLERVGP
jgi:hypothetical protein